MWLELLFTYLRLLRFWGFSTKSSSLGMLRLVLLYVYPLILFLIDTQTQTQIQTPRLGLLILLPFPPPILFPLSVPSSEPFQQPATRRTGPRSFLLFIF